MESRNVVIIGSGPAGFTAALYTARANLKPLLFAGIEWGGQLQNTTEVENYPGFTDGIQGPELMEVFRKQAERFGAEIVSDDVTTVDLSERPFKVWSGENLHLAKAVIISTGAEYRRLGIPGEQEYAGRGVSYCATCDGFFFRDDDILVVGGGDSAVEEAIFLTRFGKTVGVVHRRDELRASKIMQDRAFANPKIDFVWDSVATEAVGEDGKLTGVRLRNVKTGEESLREAGALFIAIGHDPATKLFEGQVDLDEAGYVIVEPFSSRTSVEGVFAGGDCVDHTYRQAITAAGMGCMAAIDAERWLEAQSH
ncbi:MAG TPA: thioredoxin-disulfide reductase [Actinomycetota bacterium]|jgi:thioredoxin reductase (NADPH)|nr:thioredoxin-disulfide reductase [Actinomycetota bacterium]